MASEQFSLCWDNFYKNMSLGMNDLLENEDLVDVTLAVEGRYLKAHKMVLSVCSPYFKELFKVNPCKHPIVFMKDVSYIAMNDLLQFMYQGEVQVSQENLSTFIKTAEALQIKGLTGEGNGLNDENENTEEITEKREISTKQITSTVKGRKVIQVHTQPVTPAAKRQKLSAASNSKNESASKVVAAEELLQFKIEPFDQNQMTNISVVDTEEHSIDEPIEESGAEEIEEFSVIEEGDEPKAGTSTDTAGEGQDVNDVGTSEGKVKRKANTPRYIVDGFVFHVNITKGKPPMIYLRCLEYKRLGCHARAIIPYEGTIQDIKLSNPHNHPPDFAAEEKIVFMRELKEIMINKPNLSPRLVYNSLSELYPNAARETPFDSIRYKMNRWRRECE